MALPQLHTAAAGVDRLEELHRVPEAALVLTGSLRRISRRRCGPVAPEPPVPAVPSLFGPISAICWPLVTVSPCWTGDFRFRYQDWTSSFGCSSCGAVLALVLIFTVPAPASITRPALIALTGSPSWLSLAGKSTPKCGGNSLNLDHRLVGRDREVVAGIRVRRYRPRPPPGRWDVNSSAITRMIAAGR